MIARKRDPNQPNRAVFSPFRYDRESGNWVPIESAAAAFLADIDAGRVCMAHFQRRWQAIDKTARILRALCEHPGFEAFQADGIDGMMIREMARELSLGITVASDDVGRLLDEPGQDDVLEIRGKHYQVSQATGMLESCEYEDEDEDEDEDGDPNGGHS